MGQSRKNDRATNAVDGQNGRLSKQRNGKIAAADARKFPSAKQTPAFGKFKVPILSRGDGDGNLHC